MFGRIRKGLETGIEPFVCRTLVNLRGIGRIRGRRIRILSPRPPFKISILVVGESGAGKTCALFELVHAFREEKRDHLFIAVDRLAARSISEARKEIGLDHELLDVLDNWIGLDPAFIVIDALDAARGDSAGVMIRDLILIRINRRLWRRDSKKALPFRVSLLRALKGRDSGAQRNPGSRQRQ
jgi:hypothetical protein